MRIMESVLYHSPFFVQSIYVLEVAEIYFEYFKVICDLIRHPQYDEQYFRRNG